MLKTLTSLLILISTLSLTPMTGAAATKVLPYTVTASAGSGGTITPKGKITVPSGGSQSFSIVPNGGYHITDVKIDGVSKGPVTTATAPADFTANKTNSHKLAATFAINTYQLTVQGGSGGKISISSKAVKYGTKVPFTVTPNAGYAISSMTVGAPGETGTTPAGSYGAKGVFKGTLTVTTDVNLSVTFVQQGNGGGGSGSNSPGSSGFTSSMLSGKTVYLANPDGYSVMTFKSNGTVTGSSSVTSGTPVASITASWMILSDGTLVIYSGTVWSYAYALVLDYGTYWNVIEVDSGGTASTARMYYGSGAFNAAQAYYSDTYGYNRNPGSGATDAFTEAMLNGKTFAFTLAYKSVSEVGTFTFNANGTFSGTGSTSTGSWVYAGTWSVNRNGQLIMIFSGGVETDTITVTSMSSTTIIASDSWVDPSATNLNGTGTLTLIQM